jgi:multidrug efflux pump subunit AcrA (membrane-fusion protein)
MKSYPVEVYMEKPGDSEIKSGMFARCEIYARTKKNVVIAPENAITINNDGSAFVYVDDNGKAVQKQVKLGVKNDGKYEIASGLEPNVKIITAGKERLKDGILIVENAK